MAHTTLDGTLQPDGTVILDLEGIDLPNQPLHVLVTILEPTEQELLTDVGDYLEQLENYEDQLAAGKIQWQ